MQNNINRLKSKKYINAQVWHMGILNLYIVSFDEFMF